MSKRHLMVFLGGLIVLGEPQRASAETGALYGFGDSLLDTGRVCSQLTVPVIYNDFNQGYGTCSNGRGALQWLPDYTPYAFSDLTNLSEGGAGTGSFNVSALVVPGAIGARTQIQNFVDSGAHIGAHDLVVYSASPNNRFLLGGLGPLFPEYDPTLDGPGLANRSLGEVADGLSLLESVGGRNFIVYGGRPGFRGDTPELLYTAAFNGGLASTLAALSAPGTRFRIFDYQSVYARAGADPARYGLSEPFVFSDGIHPTQSGHQLMARYIARLSASADGVPASADLSELAATSVQDALVRRLDSRRDSSSPSGEPWTFFLQATYADAHQGRSISDTGWAEGFDGEAAGALVGVDYALSSNLKLGVALNYTNADADVDAGWGNVGIDSVQGHAYASYTGPKFFADALVGYADHDVDIERVGVIDTLSGHPDGHGFLAALRGGYLLPASSLRIGPLLGLAYANTRVDSYTESGDDILAQRVEAQSLESLTLSAGLRVRAPRSIGRLSISPYFDLEAAYDVLAGDRTIATSSVFAPDLRATTIIDERARADVYGRITSGVAIDVTQRLSLTLDGLAMTSQDQGGAFRVSAGLSLQF